VRQFVGYLYGDKQISSVCKNVLYGTKITNFLRVLERIITPIGKFKKQERNELLTSYLAYLPFTGVLISP